MKTPLFAHIGVTCKNPKYFMRFYTQYFGFKKTSTISIDATKELVFLTNSEGICFEVFLAEQDSPIASPTADGYTHPGWRHMAFSVQNITAFLHAMGADAQIQKGPIALNNEGWKAVWIQDPEGNIIELTEGFNTKF